MMVLRSKLVGVLVVEMEKKGMAVCKRLASTCFTSLLSHEDLSDPTQVKP